MVWGSQNAGIPKSSASWKWALNVRVLRAHGLRALGFDSWSSGFPVELRFAVCGLGFRV